MRSLVIDAFPQPSTMFMRTISSISLCLLLTSIVACAPSMKDPKRQLIKPISADNPATTIVEPVAIVPPASTALTFSATKISISVLSQIDFRATPPSVDVRIECRDQLGDFCKVVGVLRMTATGSLASQSAYSFEVPLTTLKEQSGRWEAVTSTYVARLAPPWASSIVAENVVQVTATVDCADGSQLHVSGEIR